MEKENQRQERVFQMLTGQEWLTESEKADHIGASRSTVQRDKRKLQRRLESHYIDLNLKVYSELKHRID
jgi:DeoR/GlpR family transcriptional regulator of sugar metabolism